MTHPTHVSESRTRALLAGLLLGLIQIPALVVPASAAQGRQQPLCLPGLRMSASECTRLHEQGQRRHISSRLVRQAASGTTTVYDSDPFADVIDVSALTASGLSPTGQIALTQNATPIGLAVDGVGNLYVAASALFGPPAVPSVEVFPPGATQPSITYTKDLSTPVAVAVDRHDTVYVANIKGGVSGICDSIGGADGDIVEFKKGGSEPTRVLTDLPGCPQGVAVDRSGDVFVSFIYTPASETESNVIEFRGGKNTGTPLNLVGSGGDGYYGLAVDNKGNLVVGGIAQLTMLSEVLTFAPGSQNATSAIRYGGQGWQPQYFGLQGNRLFAPAFVAELFLRDAAVFDYPSGAQRFTQNPNLEPPHYPYGFAASP